MLSALEEQFRTLDDDASSHLTKEERILFPYIAALEAAMAGIVRCLLRVTANPIDQMEHEHDVLGRVLETMRQITGGYSPACGCRPTFAALYDELGRIKEADLHEHIHLENNILFPRAIGVESAHEPAVGHG